MGRTILDTTASVDGFTADGDDPGAPFPSITDGVLAGDVDRALRDDPSNQIRLDPVPVVLGEADAGTTR